MKEICKIALSVLLILMILPYLLTLFLSGRKACPITREADMEDYLPIIVAMQTPWDYSKEAIQAQSIVARTNLYLETEENQDNGMKKQAAQFLEKQKPKQEFLDELQKFQEAVKETEGEVLIYQGKVREVPFHRISAAVTRDGKEVLGEEYTYLPSVQTSQDMDSEEFLNGFYFTKEELEKKLKEKYSGFSWADGEMDTQLEVQKIDSTGYVLEFRIGNEVFMGEEIRKHLGLTSSCFQAQVLGEEIRFLCKGVGHGIGLSQYTSEKMAKEGKSYEEILSYFFPDMQLSNLKEYQSQP